VKEDIKLEIKRIRPEAKLPFYANPGDAGMDICAAEDVFIKPGQCVAVSTGLILNIPEGYEVQIRPRSGLSFKTRLRIPNSPGTIDSGYKDELKILLYNASPERTMGEEAYPVFDLSEKDNRAGIYQVRQGDRICQMVLAPVSIARVEDVEAFSSHDVEDRGGGFGSSGLRAEGDRK
jgi:dUTP pyrophosphatase